MQKLHCSRTALKRFACLAMLIDHIGVACLQVGRGVPYVSLLFLYTIPSISADKTTQMLILLNCILRSIGRFAFPIFAYFLVKGFLHTKDGGKYLLRLVCFGLIAEPIFDFTFFGTFYYPAHQNVYATLALGLLALMLLQQCEQGLARQGGTSPRQMGKPLLCGIALLLVVCAGDILHTDYGTAGVLLMVTLYLVRRSKGMQSVTVACLTLDQFPAPFAALPLALYDGTLGRGAKWERWAFYAFYPAHLFVLGLVTHFLM